MTSLIQTKLARAQEILRGFGRVVVAFSGGVDSTLLLKLARETLGRNHLLAVIANSPSMAQADLEEARRLASSLDVECLVINTAEVDNPAYRANGTSRCYFCKQELFSHLQRIAEERGMAVVLYGAITDDLQQERPGALAAADYAVRAPLQEAGLSKAEVRQAAKAFGLPNWDRPQNACLASRIPHGLEVTPEKLRIIEQAEAVLRRLGFQQVRVRHLGEHARIEVGQDEVERFVEPTLQHHLAEQFGLLGFHSVGIDQRGYRAGGADASAVEERVLPTVLTA